MNTNLAPLANTATGWHRSFYAFPAEKEQRSGSRRTVGGYSLPGTNNSAGNTGMCNIDMESDLLEIYIDSDIFLGDFTGEYFATDLQVGQWYRLAFTWTDKDDRSTAKLTVNTAKYNPCNTDNDPLVTPSRVGPVFGMMDEIRFSSVVRSDAWIRASYYTCWDNLVSFSGSETKDNSVFMDVKYTWDAGGNLVQRDYVLASENETFSYDFLDRLVSVAGVYADNYTYTGIGNIASHNGTSYTYGSQPHAVTAVGATGYGYDANGNMITRGSDNITWDAENRPVSITTGNSTATFVYDGDGNRVKKTEGGETVLYVNRYYEKNLITSEVTTYYYLGAQLVATHNGTDLKYIHKDHLSSTSVVTDSNGDKVSAIKYYPYGTTRSGDVPTDRKFTGQRLDGTGLYYYNARYYDSVIGRFISADILVQDLASPQTLNRYSYVLNNPLKFIDPTGHKVEFENEDLALEYVELYKLGLDLTGEMWNLILEWAACRLAWEELIQKESKYTQHMIDSEITFEIADINLPSKTVTYLTEMRGEVNFDEPVQQRLSRKVLCMAC